MRNKSVQIIIVTLKIWNLSLRIHRKFANINSAFFLLYNFFFCILKYPYSKKNRELCDQRICQAAVSAVLWNKMICYDSKEIYF